MTGVRRLKSGYPTWTITQSAVTANPALDIGQRLISNEVRRLLWKQESKQLMPPLQPMSIVLNAAISQSFGAISFDLIKKQVPAEYRIEWVMKLPDRQLTF